MTFSCAADDPLPPTEVRGQIENDLGTVLREANAAIRSGRGALPSPTALAMFERVLGIDTPIAQAVHDIASWLAVEPTPFDVASTIEYLNDRVFDDASYIGNGVYQVSAQRLCATTVGLDPDCAAWLAKADLRIRTTISPARRGEDPSDGGLVFAIEVDADHDMPLTITLDHLLLGPSLTTTSLTVELDLDALQRALRKLAAVAGSSIPQVELAGQVTATLQGDPTGASITFRIDRPLLIKVAGASGDLEGGDTFALSSAASQILGLVLTSREPGGAFHLNVGETTVELPARADGRRVKLDLAGLTAAASLETYLPLLINDIGFGGRAAVVSIDGVPAQTIDINPDDGHDFNVLVQPDEADHALDTLDVIPKLDLRITVDHDALGEPTPVSTITRVQLDGTVRTTAASERLEVTAGTFRIETDPGDHGFTATPGQCVTGTEVTAPSAPPFVEWTVGTCQ